MASCLFFKVGTFSDASAVKSLEHWLQNDFANEWREYVEGWVSADEVDGVNKGAKIDPSNIQGVPMSFIVGT